MEASRLIRFLDPGLVSIKERAAWLSDWARRHVDVACAGWPEEKRAEIVGTLCAEMSRIQRDGGSYAEVEAFLAHWESAQIEASSRG